MDVTLTPRLEGPEAAVFDAFVLASPAGHPSQTRAWVDVARAAAHVATTFAVVRDGARVAGTALMLRPRIAGVGLPWAWIDRGPVVERVDDVGAVSRAIARAARKRGVARLRVMPYWADEDALRAEQELRASGFRDVQRADGAHASTLRIAIGGKSEAELFAGKSKEQVRWRAKQADKAGARARRGTHDDWTQLRALHGAMMTAQGKRDRSRAWWEAVERFPGDDARGAMFACDFGGRVVAACVVLRHGARATYAWGASVPDKLPFSKAIPSLVAAIRWARDVGCTTFDLGGIPLEEDRDPKRNAIATFKFDFDKKRVRLVREHGGWC
jgi:hypothetical protein